MTGIKRSGTKNHKIRKLGEDVDVSKFTWLLAASDCLGDLIFAVDQIEEYEPDSYGYVYIVKKVGKQFKVYTDPKCDENPDYIIHLLEKRDKEKKEEERRDKEIGEILSEAGGSAYVPAYLKTIKPMMMK